MRARPLICYADGMKKLFRRVIRIIIIAAVIIILIVGFWRPGILRGWPNDGHQLGGDLMTELSGNTVECFDRAITLYEHQESWRYTECDIRETKDHHLVVFHDWDISSLEDSDDNRAALGEAVSGQAIRDLTLKQIQGLKLNCGNRIPSLEQVLAKAVDLKLKKPLLLEFKHLHSDQGREQLFDLAKQYRDEHGIEIHFLSFVRNVEICFPDTEKWMTKFSENGFRVYQVYRPKTADYDLCPAWK